MFAVAVDTLANPVISIAADDSSPFAIRRHPIRGATHQVWPLHVGPCPDASGDLLILSSEGSPPESQRFATWMPCGSALRPGDPQIRVLPIAGDAVVVDVARIPGRTGPQLLSVHAKGLRIEALSGPAMRRELLLVGGLPLPPRPWGITRLPFVDDWNGDGRATALVPATAGAWLVDFAAGEPRPIELPVHARYETFMPDLPETHWNWLAQEVEWPVLVRADDDGDRRLDLFALSRWRIAIHRVDPSGLPARPTRILDFTPFDAKTERRPETTAQNYYVRDLDDDGRADLVLNTIEGGLVRGRSKTRIHRNRGPGVSLASRPDVVREAHGGIAGVDFVDLEGDGRIELLETSFEFGVLQLARVLVSQRAEITVRILALDAASPSGVRVLFEDGLSLPLDFANGRFSGYLPGFGDWNGDGRSDLFVPHGDRTIGLRLGRANDRPAGFGPVVARQVVPLATATTRTSDLDADGLDDLVFFTPDEDGSPLVVLENRGRLPGSPARLRSR